MQRGLLSKRTINALSVFAKQYLDNPKAFQDNRMFGQHKSCYVWSQEIQQFTEHGGGSIMVWGYFATSGTGQLAIIEGIMNSVLLEVL